jgi:hypothetical protein
MRCELCLDVFFRLGLVCEWVIPWNGVVLFWMGRVLKKNGAIFVFVCSIGLVLELLGVFHSD